MRSSTLLFTVVLSAVVGLLTSDVVLKAGKPKKTKRPKPVDWKNPYYSTRFLPCKKLRIFNPVELVKAQIFAAESFRKCVPKIVINFATNHQFPAYGIERLAYLACAFVNIFYAYYANDGSLIVGYDVKVTDVLVLMRSIQRALRPLDLNLTMKHGRQRLLFPLRHILDFFEENMECVLDGEYMPVSDGDVVKHLMDHVKFILL